MKHTNKEKAEGTDSSFEEATGFVETDPKSLVMQKLDQPEMELSPNTWANIVTELIK